MRFVELNWWVMNIVTISKFTPKNNYYKTFPSDDSPTNEAFADGMAINPIKPTPNQHSAY
jgi:hypothetical protein